MYIKIDYFLGIKKNNNEMNRSVIKRFYVKYNKNR